MIHDREDAASWPDYGRDWCIVCGRPHPNLHHMPPIGSGRRSEWKGALLALCGSGTTGCHGAFHAGELELRYMDGRWHWRGTNGTLTARRWTRCHDDWGAFE